MVEEGWLHLVIKFTEMVSIKGKKEVRLLRKDISSGSPSSSSSIDGLLNGNRKPKAEVADKKQNGNRKPEVEVTDTNLNSEKFDDSHDDEVPGGDENDGSSLFVVALEMARESCLTMDPLNSGLYSLEVLKKKRPDYENWVGLYVSRIVKTGLVCMCVGLYWWLFFL
ncbi:unnamed protein product [Ilex paraguariensis]|uniref:Uncharacterized protein n=1 Tax=Ilex paraguariensis TaxID=185542 RepID=A0ABC8U6L0_9AQUA